MQPFRAELGLAPVDTVQEIDRVVQARLGLFPSWYAEPAADWPQPFDLAGFPLPPTSAKLPGEFKDFVRREGKPIVFTPGTGVPDVALFFEQARQCCEALGLPGVFLSRHFRPPACLGSRIRHFEFLDLELVLKHSALLVHHGGIGTTARAFEAGVPQLVRARTYDQPDNGDRVQRLGVGRCLHGEGDTAEALIAAAKAPHLQCRGPAPARALSSCDRSFRRRRPSRGGLARALPGEGPTLGAEAGELSHDRLAEVHDRRSRHAGRHVALPGAGPGADAARLRLPPAGQRAGRRHRQENGSGVQHRVARTRE